MDTIKLNNNESMSRGIIEEADGTFTALTLSRSKNFKTRKGAEVWYKKATGHIAS